MADANLTLAVDTRQLSDGSRVAVVSIQKIAKAGDKATDSVKRIGTQSTKTAKKVKVASTNTKSFSDALVALQKSSRLAFGPLSGIAARFETLNSAAKVGGAALAGFAVTLAGLTAGLGIFLRTGARLQTLQNQIRLTTFSVAELNFVQESLFEIATDTRNSFSATVNLYSRLARSTEKLNLTQTKLLKITETVNKAVAITGGTAASVEAALFQLSQGLAANNLRGQELNSILEQAPPLARALEEGLRKLGFQFNSLKSFVEKNNITTRLFIDALTEAEESINNKFARTIPTLGQAFTNLSTSFTKLVNDIDSSTGTTRAFSRLVLGLADNLDTLVDVLGAIALGGFSLFVGKLGAATAAMLGFNRIIKTTSLLSLPLLALNMGASLTAIKALTTALLFLTGPAGIVLGLAGLTAGMVLLALNTNDAQQNQLEFNTDIAKAKDLYKQATKESGEYAKTLKETADQIVNIRSQKLQARIEEEILFQKAITARLRGLSGKGFATGTNTSIDPATNLQRKQFESLNKQLRTSSNNVIEFEQRLEKLKNAETDAAEEVKRLDEALKESLDPKGEKEFEKRRRRIDSLLKSNRTEAQRLTDTLNELKALRPFAADADELERFDKAISLVKDKLEKALTEDDPIGRLFEEIANNIQDTFAKMFENIFNGGVTSFSDLAGQFRSIFAKTLAQLATIAIARPVIVPIVQGFGTSIGVGQGSINKITSQFGVSNAAGSQFGSLSSILSTPLLGGVDVFKLAGTSGIPLLANNAGLLARGFGNLTSVGGLAGGFAGNFLANSLFGGNRGIGADIGGGLGSAGGALLAAQFGLGPVGAALAIAGGSFLGNGLGGLFGGKEPVPQGSFVSNIGAGNAFDASRIATKNLDASKIQQLSQTTQGLLQSLSSAGINVSGQRIAGGFLGGRGFFELLDTSQDVGRRELASIGRRIEFGSDEEASNALGRLAIELVRTAGASGSLAIALQNIQTEGRSVDEILSDIQFAQAFDSLDLSESRISAFESSVIALNEQTREAAETARRLGLEEQKVYDARDRAITRLRTDFNASVTERILGIVDPEAASIVALQREFQVLRREAFSVGADMIQLEQLFALERQRILEDSLDAQRTITADYARQVLIDVSRLRDALLLDPELSGTNRFTRAQNAQGIFDSLSVRIRAGEQSAFEELDQTTKEYLAASLDYYGPTEQYLSRLEDVFKLLDTAESIAKTTLSVEDLILQENRTHSELLQQLIGLASGSTSGGASIGSALQRAQAVPISQLLRSYEDDASILDQVNPQTGVTQRLDRALKVIASAGGFRFDDETNLTRSFAQFAAQNPGVAQAFLDLLAAVGGDVNAQAQAFRNAGIPGFASGGFASSGFALVGEKGPELVNFGRSAQVINESDLRSIQALSELNSEFSQYRAQSALETAAMIEEIKRLNDAVRALESATLTQNRAV